MLQASNFHLPLYSLLAYTNEPIITFWALKDEGNFLCFTYKWCGLPLIQFPHSSPLSIFRAQLCASKGCTINIHVNWMAEQVEMNIGEVWKLREVADSQDFFLWPQLGKHFHIKEQARNYILMDCVSSHNKWRLYLNIWQWHLLLTSEYMPIWSTGLDYIHSYKSKITKMLYLNNCAS